MSDRPAVEDVHDRFQDLMDHIAGLHAPDFLGVDLTMTQAKVLYIVSVHPSTSMSAIATELDVGLSAVSGLVDRLVAHGYLDRREDTNDRRQQLVTLTEQGADALDHIRELRAEMMRRLLAGFSTAELAATDTTITALSREARRLDQSTARSVQPPERTTA